MCSVHYSYDILKQIGKFRLKIGEIFEVNVVIIRWDGMGVGVDEPPEILESLRVYVRKSGWEGMDSLKFWKV